MLATRKWTRRWRGVVVGLGLALMVGCTPAGPRALLEGESLIRAGKYPQAIDKLRVATDLLPADGRAWNLLGLACHYGGQPQLAISAYNRALLCRPFLNTPRYNLGCLHLEQENLQAALQELQAYTRAEPQSALGWMRLGLAQFRTRQLPAAEASFNQALQLNASLPEAWNGLGLIRCSRGQYRDATNYFNAALRYAPGFAPAHLNQAILLQQSFKNRPLALKKYQDYLAAAGKSELAEEVQQIVAKLDAELNPVPVAPVATNAAPQLDTAIAMDNKPPSARTLPTNVMVVAEARATNKPVPAPTLPPAPRVTAAQPTNVPPTRVTPPAATTQAPPVLLAEGKTNAPSVPSGPSTREKPVRVESIPPTATNLVARAPAPSTPPTLVENASTPVREPPETAKPASANDGSSTIPSLPGTGRYPYERSLVLSTGNRAAAEQECQLAVREQKAGRILVAIEAYQKAVQNDPSFFEAYHNLGALSFQANDTHTALKAYEKALIVQPASTVTRYNFALALQKASYPEDAAMELERVLKTASEDTQARLALANLYAQQLNQPLLARQHYEKLLALEPQHPQATAIRYWLAANR